MKTIIILFLLCSCSPRIHKADRPVKTKAVRSERPKTDIYIMGGILFLVVMWCNEEGFYKHVK